jgi:hypothetical protein
MLAACLGSARLALSLRRATCASIAEINAIQRNLRPDVANNARGQVRADESDQQSEQMGKQNNPAFKKLGWI